MEPIGSFQRSKGEYVLVHRCFACGLERFNRIAGDDDFDRVLALPALSPLTSSDLKAQRLELEVGEESDKPQVA